MEYEPLVEAIIHHFTGKEFADDLSDAKNCFFEISGFVEEGSLQFEARISQFLDWYIFTRLLKNREMSPAKYACHLDKINNQVIDRFHLENISHHRHSLFRFIKLKNDGTLYAQDLFDRRKVMIKNCPWTVGFNPGEIFEARLIPHEDTYVFTRGICFHPAPVKRYILKEIKMVRKGSDLDRENLMFKLLKMRYRHDRYRHVKVDIIYNNESVFKN